MNQCAAYGELAIKRCVANEEFEMKQCAAYEQVSQSQVLPAVPTQRQQSTVQELCNHDNVYKNIPGES